MLERARRVARSIDYELTIAPPTLTFWRLGAGGWMFLEARGWRLETAEERTMKIVLQNGRWSVPAGRPVVPEGGPSSAKAASLGMPILIESAHHTAGSG
jgi:hypothetical protein